MVEISEQSGSPSGITATPPPMATASTSMTTTSPPASRFLSMAFLLWRGSMRCQLTRAYGRRYCGCLYHFYHRLSTHDESIETFYSHTSLGTISPVVPTHVASPYGTHGTERTIARHVIYSNLLR